MAIYPIPELELDRKLELAPDRKLDNCSHPIPELELELDRELAPDRKLDNCSHPIPELELELELDRPFIKEPELELDSYSLSFTVSDQWNETWPCA